MAMFLSWAEFGGPETCRESLLVDICKGRGMGGRGERREGRRRGEKTDGRGRRWKREY